MSELSKMRKIKDAQEFEDFIENKLERERYIKFGIYNLNKDLEKFNYFKVTPNFFKEINLVDNIKYLIVNRCSGGQNGTFDSIYIKINKFDNEFYNFEDKFKKLQKQKYYYETKENFSEKDKVKIKEIEEESSKIIEHVIKNFEIESFNNENKKTEEVLYNKEHIELNKFLSIIEKTAPVLEENDDYEKCKYFAGDEDEYFLELKLHDYRVVDCGDCDDAIDYINEYLLDEQDFDEEQFNELCFYSHCKPDEFLASSSDVDKFKIKIYENKYIKLEDADKMLILIERQDEDKKIFLNKQEYLKKLVKLTEEKQEQDLEKENKNKYKI